MTRNLLLSTDSYKHSHFLQYPPETQHISSYIEARVGDNPRQVTQFFGTTAMLLDYFGEPFCNANIGEAEELCHNHGLPFHKDGWKHIYDKHGGNLPVEIQALPEGIVVPRGTPLMQVHNTDPKVPWLTSFLETLMLRSVWYPSSVATLSFLCKVILWEGLLRTSDFPEEQIGFKLHDFGARGVSSGESAALGGMAHLVNFRGTDTIEAIEAVQAYYSTDIMPGFSIPASEHSTMTSWGPAREADAYENMIDQFGHSLFSIVSDSYDLFNAVDGIFGKQLKDKILGIEGKLIVRPDSGDPVKTPIEVLERLWASFGGTINSKGFRVLNPKVGVIQGDGMDLHKISALVHGVEVAGFSLDNIAVGMGGGLLQSHMRDDQRFAMKCNAIAKVGTLWEDVQKKPATDPTKTSKAGRQSVIQQADGSIVVCREDATDKPEGFNMLKTIYKNGIMPSLPEWSDVTNRATDEMLHFHSYAFAAPKAEAAE